MEVSEGIEVIKVMKVETPDRKSGERIVSHELHGFTRIKYKAVFDSKQIKHEDIEEEVKGS